MSLKTKAMFRKSIKSLIELDSNLAAEVCKEDFEVDTLNRQAYKTIYEKAKKDPERIEVLVHYLSVSRQLERIADYATNISEDIIYMIDGKIVRHSSDEF